MRQDGVILDIDPAKKVDCVLNLTILDKKTQGAICMNIDMTPMKKAHSTPSITFRYHKKFGTN